MGGYGGETLHILDFSIGKSWMVWFMLHALYFFYTPFNRRLLWSCSSKPGGKDKITCVYQELRHDLILMVQMWSVCIELHTVKSLWVKVPCIGPIHISLEFWCLSHQHTSLWFSHSVDMNVGSLQHPCRRRRGVRDVVLKFPQWFTKQLVMLFLISLCQSHVY